MKKAEWSSTIRRTAACFSAEWKRGIRLVPSFFAAVTMIGVILVLASSVFCRTLENGQILPKIQVAMVIPDNDPLTEMASGYIEAMDSVKGLAEFSYLTEEKAMKRLESGRITCAILLPENMYASVDSGENVPVRVLFRKDSGLTEEMFRNLIVSGVKMLQTSEASIYAVAEISSEYPMRIAVGDQMNLMAAQYFSLLLRRQDLWTEKNVSAFGAAGPVTFYTGTVLLAILLLAGIGFAGLYDRADRLTVHMLKRSGIGYGWQAAARTLVMTILLWLLLLMEYLAAGRIQHAIAWNRYVLPGALLLAAAAACFAHLIYGWADSDTATLVYLLAAVLLLVIGGGLVPSAYMPKMLRGISSYLPATNWQLLLQGMIGNSIAAENGTRTAVTAGVMWGLGTAGIMRHEK
ncbi:MAG: ABC transporter permease [Eubacteriales bacterium]|nr:ABC transporter permease [Eubacteriales bacterium]